MKKFFGTLLVIIIIVVICYFLYAFFNGLWPFGTGGGEGDSDAGVTDNGVTESVIDVVETNVPQDGDNGNDIELPVLIIEISEDRIIYNENEVSLEELETILLTYGNPDDIWEIHDVYRAEKAVFDEVKQLLQKLDIVFREQ